MNARELALKTIVAVNEDGAFANIELDKNLENFRLDDPRDRGLATDLVYGSIKYRKRLDYVLNQFAKPKVKKMSPYIRNILRIGLYQMIFLDRIPIPAAINEAVELTKRYGHAGTVRFVNGVLRNISRNMDSIEYPDKNKDSINYLSTYYSYPLWMIEIWLKEFGFEKTEKLCQYFNEPSYFWIRTNTLKISRDELVEAFLERGIEVQKSKKTEEGIKILGNVNLNRLDLFQEGYFLAQDESSMLVAHALKAKKNDRVLDTCAAPGGKTTHIAQLMDNEGEIFAFDIHQHRLDLIKENARRLGIDIIKRRLGDARVLSDYFSEEVSHILVDAPCSGLGVLGRRADARWSKGINDIESLSHLQLEILEEAKKFVKKGGTIVYSTCTITNKENEEVIKRFLERNDDFVLDKDLAGDLPYQKAGIENEACIKYLPFEDDMDGFFIARLKRL